MNQKLERYLNDHLAGSSGALLLIGHLIDSLKDPLAVEFFQKFKTDVERDQRLLEFLLTTVGLQPSGVLKTAGNLTARMGSLKLMWEGLEPGKLGLFEALEMLTLGVQGKRLLWVALREIASTYPAWKEINFTDLEADAIRQRDGIEVRRIQAAHQTFASGHS